MPMTWPSGWQATQARVDRRVAIPGCKATLNPLTLPWTLTYSPGQAEHILELPEDA